MTGHPSTARLRRIGRVLRSLREEHGYTLRAAGRRLERSGSSLSLIESGQQWLRGRDLTYILDHYKVDADLSAQLLALAAQEQVRGWWDDFRKDMPVEAVDHASLEYASATMDIFETHYIPGLLQTEDYARGVIEAGAADPSRVERFVAFRMARQQVLSKDDPPRLRVVVEESVLHRIRGGPAVARGQCQRLLEINELPNVTVQVLPLACAIDLRVNGPFTALTVGNPALLRLVLVDSLNDRWLVEDDTAIGKHVQVFDTLCTAALPPEETRALIERLGSGA